MESAKKQLPILIDYPRIPNMHWKCYNVRCKNLPQKYINNLIISSNVAHMNKQAASVENLSYMISNIDMHLSTLMKLSRLKNGMNHTLIVSIDVGRI